MSFSEDDLRQVWCCIYNYPNEGELIVLTKIEFREILHLLQDPEGALDFCSACNEAGEVAMFVQGVGEDESFAQGVSISREELKSMLDDSTELNWDEVLITPENIAPPQAPKKWEIN